MRILYLTSYPPYPPRSGASLRAHALWRALAARWEVHLLSLAPDAEAARALAVLPRAEGVVCRIRRPLLRRLWETLASPRPDLLGRAEAPPFWRRLTEVVHRIPFDAVHISSLEMAPYGLYAALETARIHGRRPRLVYDAYNAEYLLQRRAWETDRRHPLRWPAALYSWLQARKLARYETHLLQRVDGVVVVSSQDARALQALVPHLHPLVVANGVDVARYLPPPPEGVDRDLLVFSGTMSYRPNVDAVLWFAREVWPRLKARRPQLRWRIVGRDPLPRVRRLERIVPGVEVTGTVEDARPWIAQGAVYVAPLRVGGGSRLKLLEALALERPVVATGLAAEGLELEPGVHYLRADDPEAFAQAVLSLLGDPQRARALGRAGRALVEARYDWGDLGQRLVLLYEKLFEGGEGG